MAGGSFGGGSGTYFDPYIVEDAEDLQAIGYFNTGTRTYFKQYNGDIYLNVPPYNSGDGWIPVPLGNNVFMGPTYARYIRDMMINSDAEYIGLFSHNINDANDPDTQSTDSMISNVYLRNINITVKNNGTIHKVGGLIGYITDKINAYQSFIVGCTVTGIIKIDEVAHGNCIGSAAGTMEFTSEYLKTRRFPSFTTTVSFTGNTTGNFVDSICGGESKGNFSGGSGAVGDPYIVSNAFDLKSIHYYNYTGEYIYFKQNNNIDLNISPFNTGSGWKPVNIYQHQYNGDNYAISNLFINTSIKNVGLFSNNTYTGSYSRSLIKNVKLIDINITVNDGISNQHNVGGLIGNYDRQQYSSNNIIENCVVTGTIQFNGGYSSNRIGGLIGNCTKNKLLGCTSNIVINCIDGIDPSLYNYVGGIGGGEYTYILRCASNIKASGYIQSCGGILSIGNNPGISTGSIEECCSYCDISSTVNDAYLGGISGMQYYGDISDCYAIGNIEGESGAYIGGISGDIDDVEIRNVYASVEIDIDEIYNRSYALVGYIGYSDAYTPTFRNAIYEIEKCDQQDGYGFNTDHLYDKHTSEMKVELTYTYDSYAPFDFTNIWGIDAGINNGYPYLLEIDYSSIIIPEPVTLPVGYKYISTPSGIMQIPLYLLEDLGVDITAKRISTPAGIICARLVDLSDPKASPYRVSTPLGIMAYALE